MNGLKRAWGIVSPMVIFLVIQHVISFSVAFTFMNSRVDVAETLSDKQLMELQIDAAEMLGNHIVLMSGIAAMLCIPIFYRALNKEWMKRPYRILPISGPFRRYIYVILTAVGMTTAFNLAVNAFELFRYDIDYARLARGIYSEPLYMQIMVIGFLMPIVEELMFRGLIFERLGQYGNETARVILTSILFGVYHGTIIQIAYAFVFSMLMIFAYKRTGTFWAPVLFHIASNLSSLALNQMNPLSSMGYSIGIVAFFLLGLFGLYGLKQGKFYKIIPLQRFSMGEAPVECDE